MTQTPASPSPSWGPTTKLVVALTIVAVASGLVIQFHGIIAPLLMALVLAYLFNPVAGALQRTLRISWSLSVGIIYFVLLLLLLGALTLGGLGLVQQIESLISIVRTSLSSLPEFIENLAGQAFQFGPFRLDFRRLDMNELSSQFMTNFGTWAVNTGKYLASLPRHTFRQSHAAFHFLLDFVPNWELAYGRGGLIQYQSFIPKEHAEAAWREMLVLSHKRGLPSYLGVTKRHRPDRFLLSHSVDGFSMALDFKVTRGNHVALGRMLQEFDNIVVSAGGRFYFAKNSETLPVTAAAFLGRKAIAEFQRLKRRCDPDSLLQSNLYRRLFT